MFTVGVVVFIEVIKFARFSAALVLMTNWYLWKGGVGAVMAVGSGVVQGMMA